ncbi:type II toxin-antitoxin system MqsA family antitoxin [Photorhabdus laumondii]|uniref:YgiT-type zinc finger domain-containing protein n=1 Tax=Photorhabdus laumondii subsp. clarkei TaxID=2029685 RepID=A0A329VIG3_9GAMM|nr:hypothetical protein CKY01_05615 [Photorhabdus laumondii subsp. clarkei]
MCVGKTDTYKGETIIISAVTGDFCPACAESILDAAESERVMCEMQTFSKKQIKKWLQL